jgi:hypothetical protein
VRPEVAVDVAFLGVTTGGLLRQPSIKGLRLDLESTTQRVSRLPAPEEVSTARRSG